MQSGEHSVQWNTWNQLRVPGTSFLYSKHEEVFAILLKQTITTWNHGKYKKGCNLLTVVVYWNCQNTPVSRLLYAISIQDMSCHDSLKLPIPFVPQSFFYFFSGSYPLFKHSFLPTHQISRRSMLDT